MNNSKGAMLILSSILISSVLTYILTKAYYTKRPVAITPDELPEQPKKEEKKETPVKQENPQEKVDVMKYAEKYKQKAAALTREYQAEEEKRPNIEIIDADIFGTNSEYVTVTYTYYASDRILADEENEVITDYDNSVGKVNIERFDDLEHDGAVYVRNHEYGLDIEILRDLRTYKESLGGHANGRS